MKYDVPARNVTWDPIRHGNAKLFPDIIEYTDQYFILIPILLLSVGPFVRQYLSPSRSSVKFYKNIPVKAAIAIG